MALPANSTDRIWLGYTSLGVRHRAQFRVYNAAGPADFIPLADALAQAMSSFMILSDQVSSLTYQVSGGNISLPLPFTPVPGTNSNSSAQWTEDPESAFYGMVGRGNVTGHKWHLEFFTPLKASSSWPLDNRYAAGENPGIDAWRLGMQNAIQGEDTTASCCTIAGEPITVYTYVNIAKNAYWQRKQRT